MIEVEVRGRLTKLNYLKLKRFLAKNGKHLESHRREMYLVMGYPGYSKNPLTRRVDIRLRNTDGQCEIIVKKSAFKNNVGRHEVSLKLTETNLTGAKAVVKAFGYSKAIAMIRQKEIFQYRGVEWSLVTCPKAIYYFEAECLAKQPGQVARIHQKLLAKAGRLNLSVFSDRQNKEFIYFLDYKVNQIVNF